MQRVPHDATPAASAAGASSPGRRRGSVAPRPRRARRAGMRAASRGLVHGRALEDEVAAERLLGLGERAVGDHGLAVADAHGRRGRRRVELVAAEHDARLARASRANARVPLVRARRSSSESDSQPPSSQWISARYFTRPSLPGRLHHDDEPLRSIESAVRAPSPPSAAPRRRSRPRAGSSRRALAGLANGPSVIEVSRSDADASEVAVDEQQRHRRRRRLRSGRSTRRTRGDSP